MIKNNNLNSLFFISLLFFVGFVSYFFYPISILAQQSINIDASALLPQSTIFLSPALANVSEGSVVETPVYINTENKSINTIELNVNFDPTKLEMVKFLSGDDSIIDIFVDKPSFSNINGTVKLSGVIPSGVVTPKGLITTMVFKAIRTGKTQVSISETSRVLANDGQGTEVVTKLINGSYFIGSKPPSGPNIFSKTHPFDTMWYSNNNPEISWNKDSGVTNFSYILDNKSTTIPSNDINIVATNTSYNNLSDGIWYFHIKAKKQGVWGPTTHFALRIDMTPPATFKPVFDLLTSSSSNIVILSFSTKDISSGIDHYEVSTVENNRPYKNITPFLIVKSPYRFSMHSSNSKITVRAFDVAGNYTDESVDINISSGIIAFLKNSYLIIFIFVILLVDFLLGYKIVPGIKKLFGINKIEENTGL